MKKLLLFPLLFIVFISCTPDQPLPDQPTPDPPVDTIPTVPVPTIDPTYVDSARAYFLTSQAPVAGTDNWTGIFSCYNADLSLRWKKIGLGNTNTRPLYEHGRVYAALNYFALLTGTPNYESHDNLYALDAMTGNEIWSIKNSGKMITTYVVRNDTIYCGRDNTTTNQVMITAINATNGQIYYDFPLTEEFGPGSVNLNGNLLYYLSSISLYDTRILLNAFDVNTKTVKWVTSLGYNISSNSNMLFVDNMVCIKNGAGGLTMVDKNSGAIIWNKAGDFGVPTYSNSHIYSISDSKLYQIHPQTGVTEKVTPTGMFCLYEIPSTLGKDVYAFAVKDGGSYTDDVLTSYDAVTGAVNWRNTSLSKPSQVFPVGKYLYTLREKVDNNGAAPSKIVMYDRKSGIAKDSILIEGERFGTLVALDKDGVPWYYSKQ